MDTSLFLKRLRSDGILTAIRSELRPRATAAYRYYLNKVWGMDIGDGLSNFTFCKTRQDTSERRSHWRQHGGQLPVLYFDP